MKLSLVASPELSYGSLAQKFSGMIDRLTPVMIKDEVINIRRGKLPDVDKVGSAGSFFKNPVVDKETADEYLRRALSRGYDLEKIPVHKVDICGNAAYKLSAAWLVDKSGFKGLTVENVGTWPSQPLVIVNATGEATGREIADFASTIIEKVDELWNIKLSPEVEYIGG